MTQAGDFGATGDGQTDDTEALQHAIDEGVGELLLPRGDYRITRSLIVDLEKSRSHFHSRRKRNSEVAD